MFIWLLFIEQINSINGSNNIEEILQMAISLNGEMIGISILSSKVELKTFNSLKVVEAKILKVLLIKHSSE